LLTDEFSRASGLSRLPIRPPNVGREFPLLRFAELCYDLRTKDEIAISEELFQPELLCMEYKLVLRRNSRGPNGKDQTQWIFPHDKIAEFFIVQTFLKRISPRPQQHLADPRSRGVMLRAPPYCRAMRPKSSSAS
jgi:hypothetical protein